MFSEGRTWDGIVTRQPWPTRVNCVKRNEKQRAQSTVIAWKHIVPRQINEPEAAKACPRLGSGTAGNLTSTSPHLPEPHLSLRRKLLRQNVLDRNRPKPHVGTHAGTCCTVWCPDRRPGCPANHETVMSCARSTVAWLTAGTVSHGCPVTGDTPSRLPFWATWTSKSAPRPFFSNFDFQIALAQAWCKFWRHLGQPILRTRPFLGAGFPSLQSHNSYPPIKNPSSHTSLLHHIRAIISPGWQIFSGNSQHSRKLDS